MFSNFYFFYRSLCRRKGITSWNFSPHQFLIRKNGEATYSNKDVHYSKSTLLITKVLSDIYDFTFAVYLQHTPESIALTDTRIDRYKVKWKSETMGALINQREEYEKELSEFLLLADKFTIKNVVSTSGTIEKTHIKLSRILLRFALFFAISE